MTRKIKVDSTALAKYIREKTLYMTSNASSPHIGSIFSCTDILAVLYSQVLSLGESSTSDSRDRFIMSKGHAGAGLYACLAGMGLLDESKLETYFQDGSILSGHVSHKVAPNIEISTGSLGHGLPISCGIALALKLKKLTSKVFCLLSDGELNEGSNWEAILFASHHNLSNLKAIIDRNKLQSLKSTEETLALEPLQEKFKSFNWKVSNIDGHNHKSLKDELGLKCDSPHIIIANTVKGKGVSFMENSISWHYKSPKNNELEKALKEIQGKY